MTLLRALPLFLLLMGLASLAMIAPAGVALLEEDYHDARSFFYAGLIGVILTSFIAIAMAGQHHNRSAFRQLLALLAAYLALPVMLAVPFYEALQTTTFLNAYFEMVSAFTTTGATLFEPERLSTAEHLWRVLVAWLGGLLIWVAAGAVLAPLALGGFEVTAGGEPGQKLVTGSAHADQNDPSRRLWRSGAALIPVYSGLTIVLWILLLMAGDTPFVALSHAMSTLATSGISPVGTLGDTSGTLATEGAIALFLIFAISRVTFAADTSGIRRAKLLRDPELRLALVIVVCVPVLLFLRHWIASFEFTDDENIFVALQALWGATFTVLSFLTTAGFVSDHWDTAQAWSGLETPGLVLMGLALIGGGVATTAGGVKLLRVYALYLNGAREVERLIHPSSIGRSAPDVRRLRQEGAFIAWVYFMLVAMTLAAVTIVLGALGIGLENALLFAIAAMSNVGPLIPTVSDAAQATLVQSPQIKLVLAVTMVFGRLELLAIIVLLSPEAWRN